MPPYGATRSTPQEPMCVTSCSADPRPQRRPFTYSRDQFLLRPGRTSQQNPGKPGQAIDLHQNVRKLNVADSSRERLACRFDARVFRIRLAAGQPKFIAIEDYYLSIGAKLCLSISISEKLRAVDRNCPHLQCRGSCAGRGFPASGFPTGFISRPEMRVNCRSAAGSAYGRASRRRRPCRYCQGTNGDSGLRRR